MAKYIRLANRTSFRRTKLSTVLAGCLALSFGADATEENNLDQLMSMTLQELLNLKVSVASIAPESVIDTPAIVSRYDKADLEKMGINTLKGMFNFVPGIIVQDSLIGAANVQIRGIDEAFNQKVLFLLDGVPYHQPSHSLIPMEGLPWEAISHIEVIRGPGAVIHGTQASSGVINVITRKDHKGNTAFAKLGKNNLVEGSGYWSTELDNGGVVSLSGEVRREDGYDELYQQNFPDVGIISDTVHRYLEKDAAVLRYSDDSLQVNVHAFAEDIVGLNDAYTDLNTLQPFITETEGYLIHIANKWQIDKHDISVFADYNHYTFDFTLGNVFGPGVDGLASKGDNGSDDYRYRFGVRYNYTFSDNLSFTLGLEDEERSFGKYSLYLKSDQSSPLVTLFEKGSTNEFSAYSQVDYQYHQWRFLLGARLTDNERSGSKVTPRLAAVYSIDENQSIKVLYSTGFNSPNPTQTSVNLPGNVIGNNDLTAEVVEATDIAYSYSKDNLLLVANIYNLKANDFIIRRFKPELESVTFFNDGNYSRQGAEVDLQWVSDKTNLFANIAYQKKANEFVPSDPDRFRISRITAGLGASYQLADNQSIGSSVYYKSARQNLGGYAVVNLNYTYGFEHIDLLVNVNNLFDEDIVNPNNSSQNSPLVAPGEQGTHLQVAARYKF